MKIKSVKLHNRREKNVTDEKEIGKVGNLNAIMRNDQFNIKYGGFKFNFSE